MPGAGGRRGFLESDLWTGGNRAGGKEGPWPRDSLGIVPSGEMEDVCSSWRGTVRGLGERCGREVAGARPQRPLGTSKCVTAAQQGVDQSEGSVQSAPGSPAEPEPGEAGFRRSRHAGDPRGLKRGVTVI